MMSPSLSVVQGDPSRQRNEAPALSSPPKPSEPSRRPSTKYLNPTGTSTRRRSRRRVTRSIMLLLTIVFPTALVFFQRGLWPKRYWMATARKWFGFMSPELRVTIPCLSASIVREREVVLVAQSDHASHRGRRGRIH